MDDQTEVPQEPERCGTTTADGKYQCGLTAGHDGGHARVSSVIPQPDFCGERDGDGAGCLNRAGHDGPHRTREHRWGEITPVPDKTVTWPPEEWKVAPETTVADLEADVAGLAGRIAVLEKRLGSCLRRVEELEKEREERLGHAGPAANRADLSALRCQIDEQASLTRKHVTVMLTDQARTFSIALDRLGIVLRNEMREKDLVPEEPPQEPGPCPATAQSASGLVSCTLQEGHTGSHTNALAVWSDAPPIDPQTGVYEAF